VFRSLKITTVAIVSIIGVVIAIAALDIQISDRWSSVELPLWLMMLLLALFIVPLGALVIVLLVLLNDAVKTGSYFRSKVASLTSTLAGARELAFTDPITGIPNSNGLQRELERTSDATSRCLILLDLKDFRSINKRHNHWLGDEYLREFSRMVFEKSRRDEYVYKRRSAIETERDLDQNAKGFRKASGSDEFFLLLEGSVIDGVGLLNRLIARRSEFEEMSRRILGQIHPFGFTAGVIQVAPGEPFDSAVERVSVCLQKAGDPSGPSHIYWPPDLTRGDQPEAASKILGSAASNFARAKSS
jgi:GGDEF domain-containing protein